jgi:hypothetical protein
LQELQGFHLLGDKQFRAFVIILAVDVLPVHLGPQKR